MTRLRRDCRGTVPISPSAAPLVLARLSRPTKPPATQVTNHILVSYDVTALFTNVPAHETITILVEKAFSDNWFNDTYDLNLTKDQLRDLLELATTNQLFQLNGTLYEQVEGVAMGSPLGPLSTNTFMCSIEEKLEEKNELPSFYKRYVDDTFTIMPDLKKAYFLNCVPKITYLCSKLCNQTSNTSKYTIMNLLLYWRNRSSSTIKYEQPNDLYKKPNRRKNTKRI